MLPYLIYYFFKKESGLYPRTQSATRSQVIAQHIENKILLLGDMARLSKEEIIKELGQPNKTKTMKQGAHCLIWKGKSHTVQIFFDARDRYTHRDESYT